MSPDTARRGVRSEFGMLDEVDPPNALADLKTYMQGLAALSVILPGNPVRCAYPHWALPRTCADQKGHEGMHRAPVLAPPALVAEGVFTGHTYWGAPPTEWHLAALPVGEPIPHPIRDLTCGRWHKSCDVRWYPIASGARGYVCTRRSGHTGRHAAASGRRIVAVWGVRPAPAAAEQGAPDVVLEVTA